MHSNEQIRIEGPINEVIARWEKTISLLRPFLAVQAAV